MVMNNIHKTKERKVVINCRSREQMLQKLVISQNVAQQGRIEPETLLLIIRKPNAIFSLAHITDDSFNMAILLAKKSTNISTQMHRNTTEGYIPSYQQAYSVIWFTASSLEVLVLVHWARWLIHEGFFTETVTPYAHVKYNQFRKDFVDRTRHMKSLQIRKELHNKVRRNAHNTVIPAKALRVNPHPSASLKDLEEICVNKLETSLIMFSKAQLET